MEPNLVLPSALYKDSFLEALAEYPKGKEEEAKDELWAFSLTDDFDSFIQNFKNEREGKFLPEDKVPQTVYWLVEGTTFIGRISIRHVLNDHLLQYAGHIGYGIRPSERGKGYGNLMLKLALPKARELGIEKALLVCSKSNVVSRKIIEKNGGVFENEIENKQGILKLRFWVPTA